MLSETSIDYFVGQLLELNKGNFYKVHSLATNGYPSAVHMCDDQGKLFYPGSSPVFSSSKTLGFKGVSWRIVTYKEETDANKKYLNVIRKIRDMEFERKEKGYAF